MKDSKDLIAVAALSAELVAKLAGFVPVLLPGEKAFLPSESCFFLAPVKDAKGAPMKNTSGEVIRSLVTYVAVIGGDTVKVKEVSLRHWQGRTLFEEDKCPLLESKSGNKYAATHTLTKLVTSEVSMQLAEGQKNLGEDYCFELGDKVTGFQEPSFDAVWVKTSTGSVINRDDLGESLDLKKGSAYCIKYAEISAALKEQARAKVVTFQKSAKEAAKKLLPTA